MAKKAIRHKPRRYIAERTRGSINKPATPFYSSRLSTFYIKEVVTGG